MFILITHMQKRCYQLDRDLITELEVEMRQKLPNSNLTATRIEPVLKQEMLLSAQLSAPAILKV